MKRTGHDKESFSKTGEVSLSESTAPNGKGFQNEHSSSAQEPEKSGFLQDI